MNKHQPRSQSSEKSGQMFHSRLDNRVQALNVARNRGGGPGTQQAQVNSAGMSSNNRPQMTQDDSGVAARNQNSNTKAKGGGGTGSNRFQQMRQFKGGNAFNQNNGGAAASDAQQPLAPSVKLPRTGIEQVFTADRPRFIETHREFERIAPVNPLLAEEYEQLEMENGTGTNSNTKIVYDCIEENSPYYEKSKEVYIDENENIELPTDEVLLQEMRGKNYPFSGSNANNFLGPTNAQGKKINRYYSRLKPYYVKESETDNTLMFESRFESGNLRRALLIGENTYNLILKYDYGTTAYTQWYYFKVSNVRKDVRYKFNIINLIKPDSSYNQGQKPLAYSVKDAAKPGGIGWYRAGENICYYQNTMKRKGGGSYHTLSFEMTFKNDDDEVYMAHCYPYTYSDCCELLQRLCTNETKDKIRKTVLTKTLAGNDCEMVIITNFLSRPEEIALRRAVILTSRVHPGESNASYLMHGTLEYLVSEDEGARYLRDNFVFKVIPMLNPDGVIVGNYRCSLSGLDLNRQWQGPSMKQCPENFATKVMMRKTQDSRDILFYCDYHGHSRAKNLFMYGCSNQKADRLKERIYPLLFSKNSENFSFNGCNFVVQKARESTARVVMWREFNLINSFTLETTFCGPTDGRYQDCHFTITILKENGRLFCRTLLDYASNEPKVREAIRELETMFPPQKAEEGLSQHFLPQEDQPQRKGNSNFNDEETATTAASSGNDEKKNNKAKKRVANKKEGGPANQVKGNADRGNPHQNQGPDRSRASYASEHVNGGKFEESKKNAVREGKGGQPPSGGGNKKRLKSKKLTTGKMHSAECADQISITGQQQQQFQFQNNAHLSIHGHLPNGGPPMVQRMGAASQGGGSNMVTFPMVKDNNHSQANNNNNNR